MLCPACNSESEEFIQWQYSGLNDSVFNYTASFNTCRNCGLSWIGNIDDAALNLFYRNECAYFENAHFDISAPANIIKYEFYRDAIRISGADNLTVTDVGCGRGGFLQWLQLNGWHGKCEGVDVDVKSLPGENHEQISFYEGTALELPFSDNSKAVVTYFHVLEHILDTDSLLREAYRVLETNGILVIEVPDGSRYQETPVSSGFWISIREHVYHFTPESLVLLLEKKGFSVLSVLQEQLPTPEFNYSSLLITAQKSSERSLFHIEKSETASFISHSRALLIDSAERVKAAAIRYSRIVFWGVSNQMLSLLPMILESLPSIAICDGSTHKQESYCQGILVESPENCFAPDSLLVVSSWLHRDVIINSAQSLGWDEKDIVILVAE